VREQILRFLNWRTALGELIIVIVGVLIALSVDSWWEGRANRLEEAEHLVALRAEAEQNLAQLYVKIAGVERFTESTRTLIRILEGHQKAPSPDALVELTWSSFSFQEYVPQFTAYDNLLSTGSVRLLSDEKLKIELARFKATAEGLNQLDWQQDQWNEIIQPWVIENLQLDWLPESYRREHQVPDPRVLTDWEVVLNDPEFKGIVVSRLIAFADFKLGLNRILPAAEALAASLGVDIVSVRENVR